MRCIYNFGKNIFGILSNLILTHKECEIENLMQKLNNLDDSLSYNDINDDDL